MAKFLISGSITISVHTEVEASSPSAAKQIARNRPVLSLCCQCAEGEPGIEWVTSGELDGEPCELRATKLGGDGDAT